ncbi:MAG TPA: VWA domain-containing protein [Terriglobales bacterium]|nr:VWA domain-containing protein [Terriglobales bacterium]
MYIFCLLTFLSRILPAQTSINDVHVEPREVVPSPPSAAAGSISSLDDARLPTIKTDVKLVLVPVTVTDPNERFVTGLSRDNFQLFEGKTPQAIQHFSREDVPVSIGIILDVSGSMGDKLERLREAVNQFCEAANPEDEFFLLTFSDQPRLAVDFTTSTAEIEKELVFTQPKGRTSLLDALQMALHKMKDAHYGKKALLVISDGGDNHSRYSERDVKGLARESDVMIYSIGLFDRSMPTPEEMLGPQLLTEVSEPTGGRAYTLGSPKELPAVARHIGLELRTQYVLAYRPNDSVHDGKWRKIKVKLMLPRKFAFLRAHAKPGYYAAFR